MRSIGAMSERPMPHQIVLARRLTEKKKPKPLLVSRNLLEKVKEKFFKIFILSHSDSHESVYEILS